MKKFFMTLCILFPLGAHAQLNVVTTTSDLAALTRAVGGELVDVKSIARGDQDPHFLEPKPSFALLLSRADLLIEIGLELEVGWLPVLMTSSRNPKVQSGSGRLDASEGVKILEIPAGKIDRSLGDVHPGGNPHYWLMPENALIIAARIADRLRELDAANAATYQSNLAVFKRRLAAKISQWQKQAALFRGRKILTHHKSFSYFTAWTGLVVVGNIEPKPGIPPKASHLTKLVDVVGKEKVALIVAEDYYDPNPSRKLSEKTGVPALILPTSVNAKPGTDTYEGLIDHLITKIGEKI